MPLERAANRIRGVSLSQRVPAVWQEPLAILALSVFVLVALALREWSEMLHQWWNIDTYNHILLVPPIIAWLVSLKSRDLARIAPNAWGPGLALIAAALAMWATGRVTGINLLAHAGAVGAIQGAVVTILGPRAALLLALPIGFAAFLVPFGDEIIAPLQMITAEIAIALTIWSGIPAAIDGIYIDTPVGLFIVAEACSGVKFLVAMVTLAVLVCFTRFESWARRTAFMLAAIIVPILANGVRAWGTIYIAQSQGVEFAAGFDHIVYGWVFFAVVVAVLIAGAWRFFEREPDAYGWSADEIDSWRWVAAMERLAPGYAPTLVAITAIALVSATALAIIT